MAQKLTTKEQIIDILQKAGYDFITAAEEATRVLAEVKREGKPKTYHLRRGVVSFTLIPKV